MSRSVDYLRRPYLRRLESVLAGGRLALLPGQVVHLVVAHDRNCGAPSGGYCTCEPVLVVHRHDGLN